MAQIEEFPKFQYSEFIKTSTQDGQFVVRAETIEEFKIALSEMQKVMGLADEKSGTAEAQPSTFGKCAKCGAWNKQSKTGNIYCGDLCWKK